MKLYIDTSVWNFALETDRPNSFLTNEFLQLLSEENYEAVISDIVMSEIEKATELRKFDLLELLRLINVSKISPTDEMKNLAKVYIKENLIPLRHIDDALHIAIATVSRCNFIVSWNFQHIVKAKVIMGVHHINYREGYSLIEIVTPQLFLGK